MQKGIRNQQKNGVAGILANSTLIVKHCRECVDGDVETEACFPYPERGSSRHHHWTRNKHQKR